MAEDSKMESTPPLVVEPPKPINPDVLNRPASPATPASAPLLAGHFTGSDHVRSHHSDSDDDDNDDNNKVLCRTRFRLFLGLRMLIALFDTIAIILWSVSYGARAAALVFLVAVLTWNVIILCHAFLSSRWRSKLPGFSIRLGLCSCTFGYPSEDEDDEEFGLAAAQPTDRRPRIITLIVEVVMVLALMITVIVYQRSWWFWRYSNDVRVTAIVFTWLTFAFEVASIVVCAAPVLRRLTVAFTLGLGPEEKHQERYIRLPFDADAAPVNMAGPKMQYK